jgi:hypothetical protein
MALRPRPLASAAALSAAASLALLACSSRTGDPASTPNPSSLGSGSRIRDIGDPTLPNHASFVNANVNITGASFLLVDTFDETNNGKSKGTVYLQDVGSTAPYSGMSLYSPTFNPASLRPAPGDVLDLVGQYQESNTIGTTVKFPAGDVLPQIFKPTVTMRFEYQVPQPVVIDANDLNDFNKGRQWQSMLVTVQNVTFPDGLSDDGSGRDTAHITSNTTQNAGAQISNELFDLAAWNQTTNAITKGQTVKSITGVVTWFYNYHIAPRSPDDIVVQ